MSYELIEAIRAGDLSRVELLIAQGTDPNIRLPAESDHGMFLDQFTPLMVAVAAPKSTAEIVRLLLAHGADPFAVSAGQVSSTWYACGGGTAYPLTEASLQSLEPNHPFLHWGGGDVERLKLILEAGGDPNESAENGRSCVYEVCSVGDPERLRLLIERGANVWPASPPELFSRAFGDFMSEELAAEMEKMIPSPTYQLVPLFAASSFGSLGCVKLIVEAGFPADFETGGVNALSEVGNVEVAEYFWNLDVRPKVDPYGRDPADHAIEAENLPVLKFLLNKADALMIQQKLATAGRMNPNVVRLLLDLGADASKPDTDFGSPLHYACWQGGGDQVEESGSVAETIQCLIDAGADPNLLSRGKRPLHEAAFGDWGSPTAVHMLLRNGAEVDALDEQGQTALMTAAHNGELECVRVLLEAGADRALIDNSGQSALDHAREHLRTWKEIRLDHLNRKSDSPDSFLLGDGGACSVEALETAQMVVDLLSGPG